MEKEDRSCWKCGWQQIGGITLIGICWWFYKSKGFAKEIPREVCDKGCRFWTAEKQDIAALRASAPAVIEEEL